MKRVNLLIKSSMAFLSVTALAAGETQAQTAPETLPLTGYYTYIPFPGDPEDALSASAAKKTIPLSKLTFTATKDKKNYTDVIVGQSPTVAAAQRTTTKVDILVVPVKIEIGGSVFDPTTVNACGATAGLSDLAALKASPLLTPVTFDGSAAKGHASKVNGVDMGLATYNDTHRRAEFLNDIGGASSKYHTDFTVTYAPTYTIPPKVTAGHSRTVGSGCGLLGEIDINTFDPFFVKTVLPAVKAKPTEFVVLLLHDVVLYQGAFSNCCILGYHGATASGQTYGPIDYDTTGDFPAGITDVSVAAHEIGEWLDDPLGTNPTPHWGGIGQVSACQNNWEVGDPLTGTNFPAITATNGKTYHAQELGFWGWYYSADKNAADDIGAGGKYSTNGTFGGPSKACPPGGTYPN